MADNDQCSPVGRQGVHQSIHRRQIQVVRRLIEDEQLVRRLGQQEPCQRDPESLTAREVADAPVDLVLPEQEPGQLRPDPLRVYIRRGSTDDVERVESSSRSSLRCGR